MNDQNKQHQMPLSEEGQDLEEARLDEVTGGMQPQAPTPSPPWNHPFDSGTAPTTPAVNKVLHLYLPQIDKVGEALDHINTTALKENRAPTGKVMGPWISWDVAKK